MYNNLEQFSQKKKNDNEYEMFLNKYLVRKIIRLDIRGYPA